MTKPPASFPPDLKSGGSVAGGFVFQVESSEMTHVEKIAHVFARAGSLHPVE